MTAYVSPSVEMVEDFISALETHKAIMAQCKSAAQARDYKQASQLRELADNVHDEAHALSEELSASTSGRWNSLNREELT